MRDKILGVHSRLYRHLLRLIPDLLTLKPGTARVSKSPGWMDLHLDVLQHEQLGKLPWLRLSLAHYFELNGDQVADPDMEMRVCLDPEWPCVEALNITQGPFNIFREVYPAPGMVNPRAKKELNAFLAMWLRNAQSQGHRLDAATTVAEPPEDEAARAAAIAALRGDTTDSPIHPTHAPFERDEAGYTVTACRKCGATRIADLYRPCVGPPADEPWTPERLDAEVDAEREEVGDPNRRVA